MALQNPPVARTHMLIRKPVAVVFEAFADPAVTAKFWFTRGSGRLEQGAKVTWHWDMYAASAQVSVKNIENNKRIVVEWPTPVEWVFTPKSEDTTFVVITASGFAGTAPKTSRLQALLIQWVASTWFWQAAKHFLSMVLRSTS
jgi:uncharacterized protein YndB with AHSA1/START domain